MHHAITWHHVFPYNPPDRVVELRARGGLRPEDFATLAMQTRDAARKGARIRLLLDVHDIGADTFVSIRDRWLYVPGSASWVRKLAVVTDDPATARWAEAAAQRSRVPVKTFADSARAVGLDWLRSG